MMFYTYVLFSEVDKEFYIGFTTDLRKRLDEHYRGAVASTAHRRPVTLVYFEACLNEKDAIKREKYFKTGFGRRFLRNRLETYLKDFR
jgi:putative endonuclease